MIEYIFVFIITLLATYKAQTTSSKVVLAISSTIAVFVPSILSGIRDSGIGYDTEVYGSYNFDLMMSYSSMSFMDFLHEIISGSFGGEWLYFFLIFSSVKISGDIHWYYFSIQLFICLFTYLAIYKNRNKASMTIMMFMFLFTFYNISLSAMRQSIALSLALFAYIYFDKRRWIIFIPLFILVCLSHNSGVFFGALILMVWLQEKELIPSRKFVYIILVIPFLFTFFNPILTFLVSVGLFPEKFTDLYMASDNKGGLMKTNFAIGVLIYFIQVANLKSILPNSKKQANLCGNNQLLYPIFMLSMLVSLWAFRISYYFYYFSIIFTPMFLQFQKNSGAKKYNITKWMIIILIILNWYIAIVVNNENSTVPYSSVILNQWLNI